MLQICDSKTEAVCIDLPYNKEKLPHAAKILSKVIEYLSWDDYYERCVGTIFVPIVPWTDENGIRYIGIREFLCGLYPEIA